jgi:hypothetical protein
MEPNHKEADAENRTGLTESQNSITVLVNKTPTTLIGKESYVFVDIFDFYNFDLSSAQGRIIVTKINGRSAEYLEEIKNGDFIEVYWENPSKTFRKSPQ